MSPHQISAIQKTVFALIYAMSNAYLVRSVTSHRSKNHATLFLFTLVCAIGGSFFCSFVLGKVHPIFLTNDVVIYLVGYILVVAYFPPGTSRTAETIFTVVDAVSKASSLLAILDKKTAAMTQLGHTLLSLFYCKGGGMMFSIASHGELKPGMEHILLILSNLVLLNLSEFGFKSWKEYGDQVYWTCCIVLVSNRFIWTLFSGSGTPLPPSPTKSPRKSPIKSRSVSPRKEKVQLESESESAFVKEEVQEENEVLEAPRTRRRGRPRKNPIA